MLRRYKFNALLIWHWLVFFPKLQIGRLYTLPQQGVKSTSFYQGFYPRQYLRNVEVEKNNTTNPNIKEHV